MTCGRTQFITHELYVVGKKNNIVEYTWIILIAVSLFIVITFILWRLSIGRFKKEYGPKRRKLWGQRTFYWESLIGISTGITFLIMFFLKWTNILAF